MLAPGFDELTHVGEATQLKFAPLREYFINLSKDDIIDLDRELMIDAALKEHKLLMSVFTKSLPSRELTEADSEYYGFAYKPVEVDPKGNLDLRHRLLSSTLTLFRKEGCFHVDNFTLAEEEKKKVTHLICSRNQLVDSDVEHILHLVLTLLNCSIVDISFNKIFGVGDTKNVVDRSILAILRLPYIKYLLIFNNPLASISRKDFYLHLTDEDLEKLIWIPEDWVDSTAWQPLIPHDKIDLVKRTHSHFYIYSQFAT